MLLSNNANNKPIIQKYTLPWHLLKPAFFSTASDRTLYEILGVHRKASQKQLKAAYLKLSMEYHPDKVGDDKIEEAYEEYIRVCVVLCVSIFNYTYLSNQNISHISLELTCICFESDLGQENSGF